VAVVRETQEDIQLLQPGIPQRDEVREKGIQLHEIPRLGFVVHLVVLGFRQPFLGHRGHHALELLHTSLGTEPLLGKRLQLRRREQG